VGEGEPGVVLTFDETGAEIHQNVSVVVMKNRYSVQGLWSFFLLCAFPIHLWTIIMMLRDIPWLAERTNLWDAVGVGSYGLIRAFAESVVVFIAFALLGFLTPKQWSIEKRISFLSLLVLLLSAWGILSQLVFLWDLNPPASAMQFLAQSKHPVRIMYVTSLVFILPTFAIPMYLFMRGENMARSIHRFIERLSLLTMFYLFFDVIGLVIILIRNR